MGILSAPFWCLCQKLSLSPLYFNKTLLYKNSEQSSLISGPGLNSSPPEAKNPGVFCGSATTFQNQPWILIGRTDAEAKTPVLWPPDVKSWLLRKDPGAGKDLRQEKGITEWNGWKASPTQWTWVWINSRRWLRTGKSGMLQFMGSQWLDTIANWLLKHVV